MSKNASTFSATICRVLLCIIQGSPFNTNSELNNSLSVLYKICGTVQRYSGEAEMISPILSTHLVVFVGF